MKQSFLWHDYETFGRNPRRDRPAQFAAIRTDDKLNIVDEPIELFCHPPQDMLPEPEACLLTGITPQLAQVKGVNEATFANLIARLLSEPGTCGVGYNTLRFDDEVTRFLFYRNLIDPYAREWQNNCSRWDILDMVRTMYALRPEGMVWPENEQGQPSFKLEHLSQANALLHDRAHDALSDVHATIALARKIRMLQPRLFDYCLSLRKKDRVQQEINLLVPRPLIHISGMYGTQQGCLALVLPLMVHPGNSNEIIVYDLAHDPAEFFSLSGADIAERLFSKNEVLAEKGLNRLPLKSIHINKSPVVISNLKTLNPANIMRWQIDIARCRQHALQLLQHPDFKNTLAEVYTPPAATKLDVDESLYAGFISNSDRQTLNQLRQLAPQELARARMSFTDPKLAELVLRYRARNWPDTLDADEATQWNTLRAARLLDGIDGYVNIDTFLATLDTLSIETPLNKPRQVIIEQLRSWARIIAPEWTE